MRLFKIFKRALKEWNDKDPFRESAVIAYYAIFSLPGLFVLIFSLAGMFLSNETIRQRVMDEISSSIDASSAVQVQEIIQKQQSATQGTTTWGAIVGIITLLLGATGVFVQFQKSLNIIWDVEPDTSKSGILRLLRARLFSFGLIVAIAFLLMISMVISTILSALGNWLANKFSESIIFTIKIIDYVISLGVLTFLFALMLKFFPDARVKWKHVWLGSFITALLFILGKFGLSIYFAKANPASAFGAAGSIILILLWVSYSSMIVLFGAEFTHQYVLDRTGDVEPSVYARRKLKKEVSVRS
jgi:membrane protein